MKDWSWLKKAQLINQRGSLSMRDSMGFVPDFSLWSPSGYGSWFSARASFDANTRVAVACACLIFAAPSPNPVLSCAPRLLRVDADGERRKEREKSSCLVINFKEKTLK